MQHHFDNEDNDGNDNENGKQTLEMRMIDESLMMAKAMISMTGITTMTMIANC